MWERLTEASLVLVVGMGGVLGSLVFFYLVISFMNKIELYIVNRQKRTAEAELIKQKAKKASESTALQDDDELTAVITAAVVASIRKEIIVKKIQFLRQSNSNSWSTIGRMNLIGSHDVHKVGQ